MEEHEGCVTFKFGTFKKMSINFRDEFIEYWEGKIPFSSIKGYWKNYHPKGKKFVHYIMLLTPSKIHKITPEIEDEDSIDEVLKTLERHVPREVKR